jgi:hypothetical protein
VFYLWPEQVRVQNAQRELQQAQIAYNQAFGHYQTLMSRGAPPAILRQAEQKVNSAASAIRRVEGKLQTAMRDVQTRQNAEAQRNMAQFGTAHRPNEAQIAQINKEKAAARAAQERLAATGSTLPQMSLTNIMRPMLHLPWHNYQSQEGGAPLYAFEDGSGNNDGRPADWVIAGRNLFNSPRNIRAVCIGRRTVNVFYWAAPFGMRVNQENQIENPYQNKFVLNASNFNFTNTGIGALKSPAACNLEEIWIDIHALGGVKNNSFAQAAARVNPGTAQLVGGGFIQPLLIDELGEDFRERFPLLRIVVIVNTAEALNPDFSLRSNDAENVKRVLKERFPRQRVLYPEVAELINAKAAGTQHGFLVCEVEGADIAKFERSGTRNTAYKYDFLYLEKVVINLYREYGGAAAGEATVDEAVVEEVAEAVNTEKSAAELSVDAAYAKGGERWVRLVLSGMVAEYGIEAIRAEMSGFTAEGRDKYEKLLPN